MAKKPYTEESDAEEAGESSAEATREGELRGPGPFDLGDEQKRVRKDRRFNEGTKDGKRRGSF